MMSKLKVMLKNCHLSGVARQVAVGNVVDGPEPEQAVVGAVWPVDRLADVILNVTSDDGDPDGQGGGWCSPESVWRSLCS